VISIALLEGQRILPRLSFRYSDKMDEKIWQSDVDNVADRQENQNTDEEGVFLSKAALEKMAADKAAREAAQKNNGPRRLLLHDNNNDHDDIVLVSHKDDSNDNMSYNGRTLLGNNDVVIHPLSRPSVIEVEPLQIRSYIFRVHPPLSTDIDDNDISPPVVSPPLSPTPPVTPSPPTPPIDIDPSPPSPPLPPSPPTPPRVELDPPSLPPKPTPTPKSGKEPARVGADDKRTALPDEHIEEERHHHGSSRIVVVGGKHYIVRDGHSHEEPPAHGPAATVMPSRIEYMVVMTITIVAVLFFFARLDVLPQCCGGKGIAALVDLASPSSSSRTPTSQRGARMNIPMANIGGKRA
jgi:hypothetical protein